MFGVLGIYNFGLGLNFRPCSEGFFGKKFPLWASVVRVSLQGSVAIFRHLDAFLFLRCMENMIFFAIIVEKYYNHH